jgi:hypothetical protein
VASGLPFDMAGMAAVTYPTTSTTWEAPSTRAPRWESRENASTRRLSLTSARARFAILALAASLAFGLRATALSTYGLSEDEVNKARAIEHYRAGDFSANAEHPMLMKLAMWGSVEAAELWNRALIVWGSGPTRAIPIETAIRLPNAVAGAATALVLFGVADVLFGANVAMVVALLWAVDVNAIAINRIGKEDTFLLFFFLLAVWCYERAKQIGAVNPERAQRWYLSSGASFGLMLASKYMPHFLGIYAIFNTITDRQPGANRPARLGHYGAMALTFVAANYAVLLPETWRYCIRYVQGAMLPHHGYLYAGRLYVNDVLASPLGVPAGFYLRLIATKVPLVILGAAVAGAIEMVRHRRERGFVFLRVLLVFLFVPYSLMAAKFMRYALPMLAIIDVIAAIGFVAGIRWLLRKGWLAPVTKIAASAAVVVVSVSAMVSAHQVTMPFYSFYQNAVGERLAEPSATFPEETYDYGVREAVGSIAAAAKPFAVVVSDAPGVAAYYLERSGRADLKTRSLSGQGISFGAQESWVIVQNEHTTFENAAVVEQLRQHAPVWQELYARDVLATQVFRIGGRSPWSVR